jgi:hypothetical protein
MNMYYSAHNSCCNIWHFLSRKPEDFDDATAKQFQIGGPPVTIF